MTSAILLLLAAVAATQGLANASPHHRETAGTTATTTKTVNCTVIVTTDEGFHIPGGMWRARIKSSHWAQGVPYQVLFGFADGGSCLAAVNIASSSWLEDRFNKWE